MRLTELLLEKFIDKWDWEEIIGYGHEYLFENNPIDFYEKYKEHIPSSSLQGSRLWNEIVEVCKKNLCTQIIA